MRKTSLICLLLGVMILLSSCGTAIEGIAGLMGSDIEADKYVKYSMDSIYLNQHPKEYLEILSETTTVEECQEWYYEGLQVEAQYFMDFYDIIDVSDETIERIVNMYDKIYAKSKYEVGKVVKSGSTYLVSVTIYPIDIIQNALGEDAQKFADDFNKRDQAGEFDALSDREYEEKWADGFISLVESRLDQIGYLEPETISVQVVKTPDAYEIADSDWDRIDMLMIAY